MIGLLYPLGLLFGLSLPVLISLYILKVRRRPRRVASTFLWRMAVEDANASVPFQKLRRNLLLLLQLAILALLTFALARPAMNLTIREPFTAAVLIDVSAGMAARTDGRGPTRLELARDLAGRFLRGLPDGSKAAIIEYAARPGVAEPFTTDRARLAAALERVEPRPEEDDLPAALGLAASLLSDPDNARIAVFSDSAELTPALLEKLRSIPVAVENCGQVSSNLGWTAFDLRRKPGADRSYDVFGSIRAVGTVPDEVTIKLTADDRTLEVRKIKPVPDAETGLAIEGIVLEGEPVLRAEILPDKHPDALAWDNVVTAPVLPAARARVLLCSPGNYFLGRALRALDGMEITEIGPGAAAPPGDYAAVVCDRALPAELPAAPGLFIGISPWSDDSGTSIPAEVNPGPVSNWNPDHPVTARIQWSTIDVFGAIPFGRPEGARVLVEAGETPLLVLGRAMEQPVLLLAFDLFRSNFPLRAGFPIFIRNVVDHFALAGAKGEARVLRGGELYSVRAPEGIVSADLTSPGGKTWTLTPGPDRRVTFAGLTEPGLWTLMDGDRVIDRAGVNLLSERETSAMTAPAPPAGEGSAVAATGLGAELKTNREIWRWVAMAALAILFLEWVAYLRRVA